MKNYIFLIITVIVFVSCKKENGITFSGKIENRHSDSIIVFNPKTEYRKVIKLEFDGYFSDTLKREDGLFSYSDGRDFTMLYLKNDRPLVMNYNTKDFNNSLVFEGVNAIENEFLATSVQKENELLSDTKLMKLPKKQFDAIITKYINDFNDRLESIKLDPPFKEFEIKEIENFKEYITKSYNKINYDKLVLGKGMLAPQFLNYENFKGGTTSLSDLKGKYTYIDVWATWCKPCKDEIPYLQELEKEYQDKNINFVSISIDDTKDYDSWKKMVEEKNMSGIQLYAKGDTNFTNKYRITSIPRFIVIDPKGNIFDARALRPSDPNIRYYLNKLNL